MNRKVKFLLIFIILQIPISFISICLFFYAQDAKWRESHRRDMAPLFSFDEFADFAKEYAISSPTGDDSVILLPDDIVSPTGEPLLSWRVALFLKHYDKIVRKDKELKRLNRKTKKELKKALENVDMSTLPDLEALLKSQHTKPSFFFYPSFDGSYDNEKTSAVRVNEIHEKIKSGTLAADERKKAYVVLVSSANSVPWYEPRDISWKDLADNKATLYPFDGGGIYMTAAGTVHSFYSVPATYEEWKEFCGTD